MWTQRTTNETSWKSPSQGGSKWKSTSVGQDKWNRTGVRVGAGDNSLWGDLTLMWGSAPGTSENNYWSNTVQSLGGIWKGSTVGKSKFKAN